MADIKAEYLACPIRNVISRFGDKWSMLVLFLLNKSDTGIMRFNEIRRFMSDCSQKMLSQTLKNLEQSHLVHRQVYPEVPPRVEYSLTDTGKSLMPIIMQTQSGCQEITSLSQRLSRLRVWSPLVHTLHTRRSNSGYVLCSKPAISEI